MPRAQLKCAINTKCAIKGEITRLMTRACQLSCRQRSGGGRVRCHARIDTQAGDRFAGEAKDGAGTLRIDDATTSLLPPTLLNPHHIAPALGKPVNVPDINIVSRAEARGCELGRVKVRMREGAGGTFYNVVRRRTRASCCNELEGRSGGGGGGVGDRRGVAGRAPAGATERVNCPRVAI